MATKIIMNGASACGCCEVLCPAPSVEVKVMTISLTSCGYLLPPEALQNGDVSPKFKQKEYQLSNHWTQGTLAGSSFERVENLAATRTHKTAEAVIEAGENCGFSAEYGGSYSHHLTTQSKYKCQITDEFVTYQESANEDSTYNLDGTINGTITEVNVTPDAQACTTSSATTVTNTYFYTPSVDLLIDLWNNTIGFPAAHWNGSTYSHTQDDDKWVFNNANRPEAMVLAYTDPVLKADFTAVEANAVPSVVTLNYYPTNLAKREYTTVSWQGADYPTGLELITSEVMWRIPDDFEGTWFAIKYKKVTSDLDGGNAVTEEGEVEWTGQGDSEDPNSWLTAALVITADEGKKVTVEGLAYRCYHSGKWQKF